MIKVYDIIGKYALHFTSFLSLKQKNIIIFILFSVYISLFVVFDSIRTYGVDISNAARGVVFCFLLGAIIIFSIVKTVKKTKKNLFSLMWTICGILILLAAFDHDIGYSTIASGFAMVIMFPLLFMIWENRGENEVLFNLYSKAYIFIVLISTIIFVFIAPLGIDEIYGIRYSGTFANPNYLGIFEVAGFTCSLYLYINKASRWWIPLVSCACTFGLCYLSMFRTAILAIVAQLLLLVLISIINFFNKSENRILLCKKIIILFLVIIISAPIMSFALTKGNQCISKITLQVFNVSLPAVSEYVSFNERAEYLKDDFSVNEDEDYSNGRVSIWKAYIDRINFKGNDVNDKFIIPGFGYNTYAHNDYLEYAYRSGVIAGLLYLVIAIYAGLYLLKIVCKNKWKNRGNLFFILSTTMFCIVSMLGNSYYILSGATTFTYCLSLLVMYVRDEHN